MFDAVYDDLYVGEAEAIKRQTTIQREGIRAVVRLDMIDRAQGQWGEHFTLLDLPLPDGEPFDGDYIDTVSDFIHTQIEAGQKVLVHCHMGVSRSVSMTMAYLIKYEGMSLAEAFGTVREGRANAYPHELLLVSLIEHFNLPYVISKVYNPQFLAALAADV